MKIRTHGYKLKLSKSVDGVYPLGSIVFAQVLLYLSPFVSSLLAYVAFVVCVYRVLRYDARVFATDFAILMPLATLFQSPGGMSLLTWLCLFAAVRYLFSDGLRLNDAMVAMLLLANYLLTRMQMNITRFVLYFGQIILICIITPKQDNESAVRSTKQYCISLFISTVYALTFRNTAQLTAIRGRELPAYWGSSFIRFQGLLEDPNYYMLLLILGVTLLLKLRDTDRISRKFCIFFCASFIIAGVFTFSKTFALALILLVCVYIFWQFRNKKVLFGIAMIAAAVGTASMMLLIDVIPIRVILSRFTDASSISDLTTGRTEIYLQYWQLISENIATVLFGCGFSAHNLTKDPHNLYLEIIYYTGITGLILVVAFYACVILQINRMVAGRNKQNLYAKYIPLLMLLVLFSTLGGMFAIVCGGTFFLSCLSTMVTKDLE